MLGGVPPADNSIRSLLSRSSLPFRHYRHQSEFACNAPGKTTHFQLSRDEPKKRYLPRKTPLVIITVNLSEFHFVLNESCVDLVVPVCDIFENLHRRGDCRLDRPDTEFMQGAKHRFNGFFPCGLMNKQLCHH